jgi:hypothetical protein
MMALTNIDPSTFVVPEGQSLLYNSSNQYYYKSSTGQIANITSATMSLLGVKHADLPCLVYTSDLSDAVAKSSSSSIVVNKVVASASNASTVYTNLVTSQKVAKHTFLNEISRIKDALDLRLRAYTMMPDVLSVAQGSIGMYIGPTTEQFTKGILYVANRISSIIISEDVDNAGDTGISAYGEVAGTYVYSETINNCRKFVSSTNDNFVIVEESNGSYFYLIPTEYDFTDFDNAVQQIAVGNLLAGNGWEAGGSLVTGESVILSGMYVVEGRNGWEAIITSANTDTEFLMTLIAANTAKVEACEDRLTVLETNMTQLMTHLGLI